MRHLSLPVLIVLPFALVLPGCQKKGAPTATAPVTWPAGAFRMHAADAIAAPVDLPELMGSYFEVHVLFAAGPVDGQPTLFIDSADVDDAPMGCGLTTAVPLQLAADGSFTAQVDRVPLVGEDDLPFALTGARITGRVAPTTVELTAVEGRIDSAAFVGLLGSDEPGKLCDMVGGRIPCEPCADGSERCWNLRLEPALELVPTFTPRSAADVCADPACGDRPWCAAE